MKKQKIQLIILAALLVAALAVFLIVKGINDAKKASQPLMGKYTAFSIRSDEIQALSVDNHMGDSDVPEMMIERDGKSWKFVNYDGEVNTLRAGQLLSLLVNVPSDYEITDASENDYGLNDPITLVITDTSGTDHVLLFGDKNDYTGSYYMLNKDNGNVYLVGTKLFEQVCVTDNSMSKQATE